MKDFNFFKIAQAFKLEWLPEPSVQSRRLTTRTATEKEEKIIKQ